MFGRYSNVFFACNARTNNYASRMRLSFTLVVNCPCPAFRRLIKLWGNAYSSHHDNFHDARSSKAEPTIRVRSAQAGLHTSAYIFSTLFLPVLDVLSHPQLSPATWLSGSSVIPRVVGNQLRDTPTLTRKESGRHFGTSRRTFIS